MKKKLVWIGLIGLLVGSAVYEFAIKAPVESQPLAGALKSPVAGTVSISADGHTLTVTPSTGAAQAVPMELGHLTTLVDAGAVVELGQRLADHAKPHEHWSIMAFVPHHFLNNIRKMFGPSLLDGDVIPVTHIFMALVVLILGLGLCLAANVRYRRESEEALLLPPKTWSALAFFDVVIELLLKTMEGLMPRKDALAALPLITSFAVFIFMCNFLGMVPGFLPPTDNLNTTLALATVCFLAYNYWGFKKQGFVAYLKHFAGPVWWLAWFMFPLEIVSHLARPMSLAVRLMGNMFGDHLVLGIILSFHLLVLPLPVMLLGCIVCVVQTVVFTLLAIVYVALAVEEHDDHGHGHAEAAAH
jgi:F-type H+-transporting ATPase subunit a